MTRQLRKMGYNIRLIDYAPRSNFKKDTVFSASKSQNEGNALVSHLGKSAISKPLSWPSIYDLIVVTGKNL